jgi:hypothetical protein
MADITKLRPRSRLGAPPPLTEASPNLEAPEIAPAPPAEWPQAEPRAAKPAAAVSMASRRAHPASRTSIGAGEGVPRRDGRSARRTGRTVQFATRVSPEFDERVRVIAEEENILLVEVLERALEAYEAARAADKS